MSYPDLSYKATCLESTKSNIGVRGSRMAPEPGGGRLGDDPRYRDAEGLPRSSSSSSSSSAPSSMSSSGASASSAKASFAKANGLAHSPAVLASDPLSRSWEDQ